MPTLEESRAHLHVISGQARTIMARVEAANREPTGNERAELERLQAEGRALRDRIHRGEDDEVMNRQISQLTGGSLQRVSVAGGTPVSIGGGDQASWRNLIGGPLGRQFVNSATFDWITANRHNLPSSWTSPSSELRAETLTGEPTSAPSGGQLIVPEYRPGIVPLPMRPLTMAALFGSGTTTSNSLAYMQETYFDNAAAPVAEGAEKPETTVRFESKTDPVRKVAHWLPVTTEMLEDVGLLRNYLDARLRLGIELAVDDQLLNGDGDAPNFEGMLVRPGLAAQRRQQCRCDPESDIRDRTRDGPASQRHRHEPHELADDPVEQDERQWRVSRRQPVRAVASADAVGTTGRGHIGHHGGDGARGGVRDRRGVPPAQRDPGRGVE